jgi:cytochrome c-type biogenesis protein CcmF
MVIAHLGLAVSLFGMGADAAFTTERLIAARVGESVDVGPWKVKLGAIQPVAGPNWTALEADLVASYDGAAPDHLTPQSRTFWAPPQTTSVSALHTRWNGQLYTVLGEETHDASSKAMPTGRWQLRLWWKPFVPMIWLGGILVALGGLLALLSRVRQDLKRRTVARAAMSAGAIVRKGKRHDTGHPAHPALQAGPCGCRWRCSCCLWAAWRSR